MKKNAKLIFSLVVINLIFQIERVYAADYYWVGGNGNWSNYASHWATTSGGSVFHSQVPTSFDNVYFDSNSFSTLLQTVIVDPTIAYCNNMVWTGLTDSAVFAASNPTIELKVFGSLSLNSFLDFNFDGHLTFTALSAGKTIETFGRILPCSILFLGPGGEWSLLDSMTTTNDVALTYGIIHSNNHNLRFGSFQSDNSNSRALFLGTSTVTITNLELMPGMTMVL